MTGQSLITEVHALFQVIPDRSTKEELVIICPEPGCPDKSGNRSINVKTGKTNCWRCNSSGKFITWAKRLGYNVSEDSTQAVSIDTLEEMSDDVDSEEKLFVPKSVTIDLPRGFTPLRREPHSAYAKLIGKMAVRKNLSLQDFIEHDVGFTRDSDKWEPYAIFPVVEWGHTVYFQGRTYVDKPGESTKLFPSKNEVKYGSSCWVYGLDLARETRASTVIVVESILNVISLKAELKRRNIEGVVPVAVFKHSISAAQERKILAVRSIKEVCVMYDADATSSAFKERKKFIGNRRFSVAQIPKDEQGRTQDANDNAHMAVDCYLQRQFYDSAVSQLDIDASLL